MKRDLHFLLLMVFTALSSTIMAGPGDTLVVQTYTFEEQNNPETAYDSPGRRWFDMPADDGTEYQKIIMQYTLKCFEDGTAGGLGFDCGEWDYTTHTFLYEHTGVIDSDLVAHPFYLANNQDFDTAYFSSQAYSNYLLENMYAGQLDETISEDVFYSTSGMTEMFEPFGADAEMLRSQYLWTASELTDLGMAAGGIDALQMDFVSVSAADQVMKIRMKESNSETLEEFENDGFTDMYYWNFDLTDAGTNSFWFTTPFEWDGTSNIIIEITCETAMAAPTNSVSSGDTGFASALVSSSSDSYLEVGQFDEIKVPAEAFQTIDEQVTVSFWMYGDEDILPANTYAFEGKDASNNRILNAHLPWSNGRVYWDAGFDGGYDRIDKQANESNYEGQWNHWTFTKNTATEQMKMYLNGSLWHTGSDKDNSMADIVAFSIASSVPGGGYSYGLMDEFRVWDVELDEATIEEWMYKDLDASHPMYDNLRAYYQFNEENGDPVLDSSPNGFHATAHGSPNRVKYRADELFRNVVSSTVRPNMFFVTGEHTVSALSDENIVELPIAPIAVSEWEASGYNAVLSDIQYYWPAGESVTYDEEGNVVDSSAYPEDVEIINAEFEYFEEPYEIVNRWEMARFITPYGIQLDLEEGWTWEYDVSDFAPMLMDSVELAAGNWQELLDLKFLFIEGTPPRDVKRIEQPWHGNWNLNAWQDNVLPKSFTMNPDEEMVRINVTTSGHWFGQGNNCAEFCNNIHDIGVNGQEEFSWQIMQECADNPLYPQGGTWIYDRAGWCPGAPVTRREFELTEFVENDEIEVDYNVTNDPYGNYWLTGHMVFYGEPNHTLDVEINDILSPSIDRVKSRVNPMCNQPVIRLRNNGTQTLTSCVISFGVEGQMQEYEWTGSLEFLETEDVTMEFDNSIMWHGNEDELLNFEVEITLANGQADDNPFNNSGTSQFYQPPVYSYPNLDDNRIIFWLNTNNAYWETDYTIKNMDNNVVYDPQDFTAAGTQYKDTVQLNQGCYLFHLEDSDDDGLEFFANNDGNGSMRFKLVMGPTIVNLERDFGKEIKYYFFWETDIVSVEEQPQKQVEVKVYPNPASESINLLLDGFGHDVLIEITNLNGEKVYSDTFSNPGMSIMKPINISGFASGMYYVTAYDGEARSIQKIVVER